MGQFTEGQFFGGAIFQGAILRTPYIYIYDLSNFKSELRNLAHSSLRFYNRKKKKLENMTYEEEHKALIELLSFDDIIIQKVDKGNVIVLWDKSCYLEKMENIL